MKWTPFSCQAQRPSLLNVPTRVFIGMSFQKTCPERWLDFLGELLQVIKGSGSVASQDRSSMAAGVLQWDFKGLPRLEYSGHHVLSPAVKANDRIGLSVRTGEFPIKKISVGPELCTTEQIAFV